jgi:hypothetical protein
MDEWVKKIFAACIILFSLFLTACYEGNLGLDEEDDLGGGGGGFPYNKR